MSRACWGSLCFLLLLLSTPARAEPFTKLTIDTELMFRDFDYGDAQGLKVGVGGPLWLEHWNYYGSLAYGQGEYVCCGLDLTVYDFTAGALHGLNHYFKRIDRDLVTLYAKAFLSYGSLDIEFIDDNRTHFGAGLLAGAQKTFLAQDKLALTVEIGVARGRGDAVGTANTTGVGGQIAVNYKIAGPFSVRSSIGHWPGEETITAGMRFEL